MVFSELSAIFRLKIIRVLMLAAGFFLLIILRQVFSAFGFSLGYLYITLISISGFWFGIRGGVLSAAAASAIFLAEASLFTNWPSREIVVTGLFLRIFVYFL